MHAYSYTVIHNIVHMHTILQELRIQQVMDSFRFVNPTELFGVIGPNYPAATKFWAPIFQSSNLPTVSGIIICMNGGGISLRLVHDCGHPCMHGDS